MGLFRRLMPLFAAGVALSSSDAELGVFATSLEDNAASVAME